MGYQENGQNIIGFRETRVLHVIFMEIMQNPRTAVDSEKTWIFHENLPNPWIRVNFPDGVPGKWSKYPWFSRNTRATCNFHENHEKST